MYVLHLRLTPTFSVLVEYVTEFRSFSGNPIINIEHDTFSNVGKIEKLYVSKLYVYIIDCVEMRGISKVSKKPLW